MRKLLSIFLLLFALTSTAQVMLPAYQGVFNKSASGTITATTIVIGTQELMVKNLEVVTYRNGDPIPQVTDPTAWGALTTGAWCYFNNDSTNGPKYGKLYNWYAVNDARGLAPLGWHIPSEGEWYTLTTTTLGGESIAGGKMKEAGTVNWGSPNTGADNSSGFTGLPGAYRGTNGAFNTSNLGLIGTWWSATENDATTAWYHNLSYTSAGIAKAYFGKKRGFSVRCFRD